MPERKLSYKVDVDTGTAVRDLDKLGTAGKEAGRDIADGFDQAKSASEQALAALSAKLDQVESDAKGTADAVAAIKANLTVDVDDAKVTQFVSDLKNKMGVAFDQVEQDAKEFADVLSRGVDMSKTTNEIRGVGDALDHTRTEADQSGSVLANMAGNAAQDFGELGGITGTLGVGIGQLAEYATEGNIAMGELAKVAGPMAALSAATLLVSQYTQNIAETKAWEREQVDGYTDAINEAGDSFQAILTMAEDGLTGRIRDDSILGGVLDKEKTIDLIAVLDSFGLSLADVQDAIRSGATDRTSFVEWMHSGSTEADAFLAKFPNLADSGTEYTEVLEGLAAQAAVYTEAAEGVAQKNRVLASSVDSVNESLRAMKLDDDPLAILAENFATVGDTTYDLHVIWNALVDDLRDGKADLASTAEYIDVMATATGHSKEEIEQLATEQGNAVKTAGDLQGAVRDAADAQDDATDSTRNATDALQGQADAVQALMDAEQARIDSAVSFADAQQDLRDASAALPAMFAETSAVINDAGASIEDVTAAIQTQRGETESWIDGVVETRDKWATTNGVVRTGAERVADYAEALGQVAGSVDDEVIPALAEYYSNILKIPRSKQTEFETILLRGDQDEIEAFIAENSGTKDLAIKVSHSQTELDKIDHAIDAVGDGAAATVQVDANTAPAKGQIGLFRNQQGSAPVKVPAHANTAPADAEMAAWRKRQANTQVHVPVVTYNAGGYRVGASYGPTPSPDAAGVGVSTQAAPAATMTGAGGSTLVVTQPAAGPVTINLSAGVVGNRYDLQRWLRAATRDQQRLGRM